MKFFKLIHAFNCFKEQQRGKYVSRLVFSLFWMALLNSVLFAALGDETGMQPKMEKGAAELSQLCTDLINKGEQHLLREEYDLAQESLEQAYQIAIAQESITDQVYIAVNLGNIHDLKSELSMALDYYNVALDKAQGNLASRYLSSIHNNMGNLYLKIGSFSQSLQHYQEALRIKREEGESRGIANALTNLSIFYLRSKNYDRCLKYQFQALKLREDLQDEAGIAAILSSISITYRHLEDFTRAFAYIRKAIALYEKMGNKAKLASAYNNLGVLYLSTKQHTKAEEYYRKSLAMKEDSQDLQSILSSYLNLADVSLILGQDQKAKQYLDNADKIMQETEFFDLSRIFYKLMADYHEKRGNHQAALQNFKAFHSISDSLNSIAKSRQLNELEVKYEILEKERNIELLTRNNELAIQELKNTAKLRNYLYIIIGLILITSAILIWRYRSVLRVSRQLQASKEKLNKLNIELEQRVAEELEKRRNQEEKALRQSRLALLGELAAGISHELNQPLQTLSLTLENIKEAIQDRDLDEQYLQRKMKYLFADIDRMQKVMHHIRRFARGSNDDAESYFDPKQSILNAVEMVKDRFERAPLKIITSLHPQRQLIKGDAYKFEHVILNLLSNAKDAILANLAAGYIETGEIHISSFLHEDEMIIEVKDNGCGIDHALKDKVFELFYSTKSLDQGTGLGLAISKSTLKNMKAEISFESQPKQGSCFSISIAI